MGELEELRFRIIQLEKIILEQQKRIVELERRLARYENANTPPSQRRYPSKEKNENSGRIGRPPGVEGSTRETPEPTEIVEVKRDTCPFCNNSLEKPSFYESKIIEEIPEPQPVRVTEYRLAHYDCSCGKHIIAEHPDCPKQGRFGFNVQAEVVISRTEDRLPLRKIQRALSRRCGLNMTAATVFEIERRVSVSLLSEYEKLKSRIREAGVVYCDETTFKVDGKEWWLWVFRAQNDVLLVIRKSRSGGTVREILGEKFTGIVVSDGYSVYSKFGTQQRCWAHLLRELDFTVEQNPQLKPFLKELKEFYHKLKEKVAEFPLERWKIFEESKKWLEVFLDTAKGWKELKKFSKYLENGMPNWLTFVKHEGVEPTNNFAEQSLREHVVMRKIMGTLRNQKGTGIYEVLASMVATWNLQGVNPQVALVAAMQRGS